MDWYTNPWVIGVLGSIPGGFLVNYVTGKILGKRENREYLQKVIGANREVVYAIRPGISEGQVPSSEVLSSLANATARRYGVEAADLYTPAQVAEELVKEVMDSSFISSAQKSEYCSKLAELGVSAKREITAPAKEAAPGAIAEYRQRLTSSVSMLLGLLTAAMTVMFTALDLLRTKKLNVDVGPDAKQLESFIPVLAAMATMAVTVSFFVVYRDFIRRRRASDAVRDDLAIRVERLAQKVKPKSTSGSGSM